MSSATSVDSFIGRGFGAPHAESRAGLFATVETAWRTRVGGEPVSRWWVPGRLEIFGRHTDYAGGRALVAAVPRGFAFLARPRTDDVVRVIDARYGDEIALRVGDGGPAPRGWANYVYSVTVRLAANFPGASLGADIVMANDLPRAAGVSSSSALIVGLTSVLAAQAGLESRAEWTSALRTPLDRATYLGCIENGSSFQSLAGAAGVGTEGGSEDHTAILLGRPGALSQFSFVPARHLGDVVLSGRWTFLVAASGVHASKAGEVRDQFNRASRMAKALLEVWARHSGRADRSLGAALESAPDAVSRLREWIDRGAGMTMFAPDDLRRRLDHFANETGRVGPVAEAFAVGDSRRVGEFSDASQADAEVLLGNQVPETVALARAAREAGALAASSFGAGFGGSVWALIEAADAERFGREWMTAYLAVHPQPQAPDWFVSPPSPSAMAIG